MIKKLFITFLLCLFSLNAFATDPASWDLVDEDCADTGGWTDGSDGSASITIDPAGQWKLNTGPNLEERPYIHQDFGSLPNTFSLEVRFYHDALGTYANGDYGLMRFYQTDEHFLFDFCSDGLLIYDSDGGNVEVGTNLIKFNGSAEFQIWRFLVTFTGTTGDGTVDVYLTDTTYPTATLVGDNIPCSFEGAGTDGTIKMYQFANTTTYRILHVDYIKLATGLYDPTEEEAVAAQVIFIND